MKFLLLTILLGTFLCSAMFNNDIATLYRHMQSATDDGEKFPEWNPKEIEGWDTMSKDDQKSVKEFYDAMKSLYESLSDLD